MAGAVALVFCAGEAFAWMNPTVPTSDPSSAINYWNNCGGGNPGKEIWAQDGDVVTTTKWNQAICTWMQVFLMLNDWGRGMTSSWIYVNNAINGVQGSYLESLNMGFIPNSQSYPGIWWRDASRPYADTMRAANLSYNNIKQTLEVAGFDGGVRISEHAHDNGNDAVNREQSWLVGWEAINIYDTAPFDSTCLYRLKTDHGHTINMPVVNTDSLRGFLDDSSTPELWNPTRVEIRSWSKTSWHNPSTLGSSANTTAYGTYVTKIERLCLPTYNFNGTPESERNGLPY